MRAGRLLMSSIALLAACTISGGCQRLDPFRQGVATTYNDELRQLADEVNRKELAKIAKPEDNPAWDEEDCESPVTQASTWDSAPLLNAIHLRPPVAYDSGPPNY